MEIRRINDDVSVAPQVLASDIPAISEAGFKTIICNRPDGESEDQQVFAEIEAAAKKAGIAIIFQPVPSGNVSDEDGLEFGQLLETATKPLLAYCRTGTRCTILWCLSQVGSLPVNEIIGKATAAGYDVSGLVGRLNENKKPNLEVDG